MSNVPAWKRIGLKVKEDVEDDPLVSATHFDGSVITNKVAKKLNKKRQLEDAKDDKTKKPPKRVKKPKAERGPGPEKDQLQYLRQFVHDKDNWKFSKQKQNWLLKNIEHIPDSYENELIAYFEDIQGGARVRVEADLRAVIDQWNTYSKKLEEKINAELYGEKATEDVEVEEKVDKKTEEPVVESAPSKEYATRCKKLLSAMLEEPVHMEGETEAGEANSGAKQPSQEPESVPEGSEIAPKPETEDNLIIEEVEVEEYDQKDVNGGAHPKTGVSASPEPKLEAEKAETVVPGSKKEAKKAKKEKSKKKEKKEKKSKA
ncbi:hypothetical protein OXX59_002829 [Metschnikowia pulcherrima]